MGRPPRKYPNGTIVHAFNRGVDRRTIFNNATDYEAFIELLGEGREKHLVRILGYCLMPNHWHFLLQASVDDGISRFMQWLTNTHVKRYRKFRATAGEGHLYQDRFKSSIIEGENQFLNAMRYVEANAAVAGLVERSEDWVWGSAFERASGARQILDVSAKPLPIDWSSRLAEY